MKKPLNWENATQFDDFKDVYNPNKGPQPGAYMQVRQAPVPPVWKPRDHKSNWAVYPKGEPSAVAAQAQGETGFQSADSVAAHVYTSPLNDVSTYEKINAANLSGIHSKVLRQNGAANTRSASNRF